MKKFLLTLALCVMATAAYPGEGWQDRPLVCAPDNERCKTWIVSVKRPDLREASCCGEADAYIADDFELGPNGEYYAIITGDYIADLTQEDFRMRVYRGMRILVPKEKLNRAQEDGGNPSGHGVVFLNWRGEVLCYFGGTLS